MPIDQSKAHALPCLVDTLSIGRWGKVSPHRNELRKGNGRVRATNDNVVFEHRVQRLQEGLESREWQAALIMQPRDLYYYAGTAQPANLWVPARGTPILFTRRAHALAREATWIDHTVAAADFAEVRRVLLDSGTLLSSGGVIGVEQDVVPYRMLVKLQQEFPEAQLANVSPLILRGRLVKTEEEVANMREAVELWKKGHEAIMEAAGPGVREHEVAAAMEHAARMGGGDGTVWQRRWDADLPAGGIVASGPNAWKVSGQAMTVTGVGLSQALPWGPSSRSLEEGDLMVVDFDIAYKGYHCDITRTYCIGEPSDYQEDLWNWLLELHLQVVDAIRPGVTGEELYVLASRLAERAGFSENFMGVGAERGAYIGHSIGLELDELPVLGPGSHDPLPEGAVVTVEPKFMIPEVGAVMVEDDILVTKGGNEVISTLDRELFSII